MLVWIGPGVLEDSPGHVCAYPGERYPELKVDARIRDKHIAEGKVVDIHPGQRLPEHVTRIHA